MNLRGPAEHTAEDATPGELRRSVLILLLMLAALALLVAPLLADLPLLGKSTRTAIFAWLLVGLALYWMYAGMGYRPLLLVQLLLFSTAAALLSVKLLLVAATMDSLTVLRWMARYLIIAGAVCAGANLTGMLLALTLQRPNTQN
jgi:carbon starvation protein CstA